MVSAISVAENEDRGLSEYIHPRFQKNYANHNQALRLQERWHRRTRTPIPPVVGETRRLRQKEEIRRKVQQGLVPTCVFGASLDPRRRIFEQAFTPGPAVLNYVNKLMEGQRPDAIVGLLSSGTEQKTIPISFLEWLELLVRNNPPGGDQLKQLEELGYMKQKHQGQGASLGPYCERRFGLAAAMLQDTGLIQGFTLCGAAGLPLILPNTANEDQIAQRIDYKSHEETMAIDAMLKLKSPKGQHHYALIQIKAQGTHGDDEQKVFITFNKKQAKKMCFLHPAAARFFKKSATNEYLLPVQRRVFRMPIAYKKILKSNLHDDSDIVNTTIAVLDDMIKGRRILILDRPYEELSFPSRVAALIKQGFLKLDSFTRAEAKPAAKIITI